MPRFLAPFFGVRHGDLQRLLLWVPLLSAAVGILILAGFQVATPLYLVILTAIIVFDAAALFGPPRVRPALLTAAPYAYALFVLTTWVSGFYLLPDHPATPIVLLACALHLPTLYVLFFVRQLPVRATRSPSCSPSWSPRLRTPGTRLAGAVPLTAQPCR